MAPASAPDISVCVAVYRRHGPPNLATLAAALPRAAGRFSFELVVALNGIGREEAGVPPEARVVEFEVNRGVPVAWNAAARSAAGGVLCVANDDVELGEGSLERLALVAARPDAGVAGPAGTMWDIERARHLGYVDLSSLEPGEAVPVDVLSGFLLVTRSEVFAAAGGFDEAYSPCGFEEVDYCTTVRRRLGLECLAVAGVDVRHEFAISAQRSWRRVRYDGRSERLGAIAARNRAHFLAKWAA